MILKNREVVIQNMTAKANLFNDDSLTGNGLNLLEFLRALVRNGDRLSPDNLAIFE